MTLRTRGRRPTSAGHRRHLVRRHGGRDVRRLGRGDRLVDGRRRRRLGAPLGGRADRGDDRQRRGDDHGLGGPPGRRLDPCRRRRRWHHDRRVDDGRLDRTSRPIAEATAAAGSRSPASVGDGRSPRSSATGSPVRERHRRRRRCGVVSGARDRRRDPAVGVPVAERRVIELDEAPRCEAVPRSGGTVAAAGPSWTAASVGSRTPDDPAGRPPTPAAAWPRRAVARGRSAHRRNQARRAVDAPSTSGSTSGSTVSPARLLGLTTAQHRQQALANAGARSGGRGGAPTSIGPPVALADAVARRPAP